MYLNKITSEDIRIRVSKYNPRLKRISTKQILNELFYQGLIETEMIGRRRYYWLNEKGRLLINYITEL